MTVVVSDLHEVKRTESAYEYGGPWTKDSPICRKQAMKIITPCYPQANTTSKVSNLQLLAIKTELFRGWALTQKIIDSRGPKQAESMSCLLDELLSPFNFFDRYTHYAVIKASAETQVTLFRWAIFQTKPSIQPFFLFEPLSPHLFLSVLTHSRILLFRSKKKSACQ